LRAQSTPQTYDVQDFRILVIEFLSGHACPLCGQIHEVRIHGYFIRKVRDTDTAENVEITIFAIYCAVAKERNDQYTKRILPPFVTPECNIMLCNVMLYLAHNPEDKINYAKAQIMLGAHDPRTIRTHVLRGREMVEATTLQLTEVLSQEVGFGRIPELKPAMGVSEQLQRTVDEVEAGVQRMRGRGREPRSPGTYVHVVYCFHRARNELKVPLDRVLGAVGFDDTR